MAWSLDLVDLNGLRRAFVHDHAGFRLTPRLNGYAELAFDVDAFGRAAAELAVGSTAIKVWQDGELRFHGQVWEPLTYRPLTLSVTARDPLAALEFRRVRVDTTYTAQDAGAIAHARLGVQNGHRATGMVAGDLDVSVSRDRTYLAGKREDEILQELASAEGGFFFRVTPTDGTPGVRGELDILYPDAGTSREECRFEYGATTMANLVDFELVRRLPANRLVVASSDSTGGRISEASQDADSISTYGLFELEESYSDVTDTDLLGEQARAGVQPEPPRTLALTPGPDAPLLFTDFNVGDFVRVRIDHGALDIFVWARVIEATLLVDANGVETLDGLVVETLTGGRLSEAHNPARRFRARLDDTRRRQEALERRVAAIEQTPAPPGAEPTPDDPTPVEPPEEPAAPPPPPPPAPPPAPSISGLAGVAGNDATVTASADANGNGQAASVAFTLEGIGNFGTQSIGSGFGHPVATASGVPAGTYNLFGTVNSAGGTVTIGPVVVVVPVAHGGV